MAHAEYQSDCYKTTVKTGLFLLLSKMAFYPICWVAKIWIIETQNTKLLQLLSVHNNMETHHNTTQEHTNLHNFVH